MRHVTLLPTGCWNRALTLKRACIGFPARESGVSIVPLEMYNKHGGAGKRETPVPYVPRPNEKQRAIC